MRVLWLIPARSGSKSLPHKNILPLGGLPLLAWRIRTALPLDGEVWLSTDSAEYAAVGAHYGAQVPFMRPARLADDSSSPLDVCLHAMHYAMEHGYVFDAIGLLQPTSPFVLQQTLERGVQVLTDLPHAHALVSVRAVTTSSCLMQPLAPTLAVLAERLAALGDTRRQAMPAEITPCGALYLAPWEAFLRQPTFYAPTSVPLLLEGAECLDIDTEADMAFAEFCVQTGRVSVC